MLQDKTQVPMVELHALLPLVVTNALNALGAILILLIGLWLSGKASVFVVGMLSRTPQFDAMLKGFFGSLARYWSSPSPSWRCCRNSASRRRASSRSLAPRVSRSA
jgi:hypothetical protein